MENLKNRVVFQVHTLQDYDLTDNNSIIFQVWQQFLNVVHKFLTLHDKCNRNLKGGAKGVGINVLKAKQAPNLLPAVC